MPIKGIACGPEGDTIFHIPFLAFRPNELPVLFRQIAGLRDHRLLALVTALIVEDRLDKLLTEFCPRYQVLLEGNEFTFSMKIRLLEALSLIPRSIPEACHIIRVIRNDFSHNLDRTCLSDIDKKVVRKMEGLLRRVNPAWGNSSLSNDEIFKHFENLSFLAIIGLDIYITNIRKLRERISDPLFVKSMQTETQQEFDRTHRESRERGPKRVIKNGAKWEIQYDKFSEIVDQLPDGVSEMDGETAEYQI